MRVKLDENIGRTPQRFLEERRHDVDSVYDEALSGADDPDVWRAAQREERFFITLDTDFSDVRRFAPGTHAGLLLLRPQSRGTRSVASLLQRVVNAHPLPSLRGCFAVATEAHTRIRRPPEPDPDNSTE